MEITKNDLKNIKRVLVGSYTDYCFEIQSKDILDISIKEVSKSKVGGLISQDGFIKISKEALSSIACADSFYQACSKLGIEVECLDCECECCEEECSQFPPPPPPEDIEECECCEESLKDWIEGRCFVDVVCVEYLDGSTCVVDVPFEPVWLLGFCHEYSNCPSVEINKAGDLEIMYGKSSKYKRHTDNDYKKFIVGYSNVIKKDVGGILKVKIKEYEDATDLIDNSIYINLEVQNDEYKGKELKLVFYGVEAKSVYFDFAETNKTCDLEIKQLKEKTLQVSFGFIEIVCAGIVESRENREYEVDLDFQDEDVYERMLECGLSEKEIKSYAINVDYSEAIVNYGAIQEVFVKVLEEQISVRYFKYWIGAYIKTIENWGCVKMFNNPETKRVANILYRLLLKMFYVQDVREVEQDIKITLKEVLNG